MKKNNKVIIVLLVVFIAVALMPGCGKKNNNPAAPPADPSPTPVHWETVAGGVFCDTDVKYVTLKADSAGTLYVAYKDEGQSKKAVVKKLVSGASAWTQVGAEAVSPGEADYVCMDLDTSGVPYVAFSDVANSSKATVMKYDSVGNTWTVMGKYGFSAGVAEQNSFAVDGVTPFIAYKDAANSNKLTVMRFDSSGNSFTALYSPGITSGAVFNTAIDIYNNIPYVSYSNNSDGLCSVVSFDNLGNAWNPIGTNGFSESFLFQTIKSSNNGTLFFATDDVGVPNLFKYNTGNSSWNTIGNDVSSDVSEASIDVYNDIPYVAFGMTNAKSYQIILYRYDNAQSIWTKLADSSITNYSEFVSLAVYSGTPYVAYRQSNKGKILKYIP